MDNNIGKRIKSLRLEKRMTLKQVADKTGLSISFISQVERSKSSITLESLRKISEALGVSPSYFFPDENKGTGLIRRRGTEEQDHSYSSFIYTNLSGDLPNPYFDPILVTLHPGDQKGTPFSHQGQEFVYILEGTLTIIFDQEEYEMKPGDSIHMESSVPHNWFNRTEQPVRFLCISSSRMFLGS